MVWKQADQQQDFVMVYMQDLLKDKLQINASLENCSGNDLVIYLYEPYVYSGKSLAYHVTPSAQVFSLIKRSEADKTAVPGSSSVYSHISHNIKYIVIKDLLFILPVTRYSEHVVDLH